MPSSLEVRLKLRHGGFDPVPLEGKRPVFGNWQRVNAVADRVIEAWSHNYPKADNTGILTRLTPTLDIDIFNPELVQEIERAIEDRAAEHGEVLVRIGRAPKRAILFRTDEPFAKLVVQVIAPDDAQGVRAEKLEFLGDGQQVVVHGLHPDTHHPYSWPRGAPKQRQDLPYIREAEARELLEELTAIALRHGYRIKAERQRRRANGQDGAQADELLPADWSVEPLIEHDALVAYGMRLLRAGMHAGAAVNFLKAQVRELTGVDEARRQRRLVEIADIVSSAADKLEAEAEVEIGASAVVKPRSLEELLAVFDKWLHLPSHWPVLAVLGAAAANMLPGDPVWLGLIAPPSSAKTEILNSLNGIEHVVQASVLTPAALLSGTDRKRRAVDASGGLLREIGEQGILVIKDYGSLLSMRTETRTEVMAAFREIYDGHWLRRIGGEGGRALAWRGRLGLIFAATEAYDDHHAVIGGLGERHLLYRFGAQDEEASGQFDKALQQSGDWRDEIAGAVKGFFQGLELEALPLTSSEKTALHKVVELATRLRAHVERHRQSREIESVQQPEGVGRMSKALQQLLTGFLVVGLDRGEALGLAREVALGSVPKHRRQAFELLTSSPQSTRELALRLNLPTTTTRRILEDLAAQKMCHRERAMNESGEEKGSGADTWSLSSVGLKYCISRE
jgi:hypothetical protein